MVCGCEWCLDFGSSISEEAGVGEDDLRELPDLRRQRAVQRAREAGARLRDRDLAQPRRCARTSSSTACARSSTSRSWSSSPTSSRSRTTAPASTGRSGSRARASPRARSASRPRPAARRSRPRPVSAARRPAPGSSTTPIAASAAGRSAGCCAGTGAGRSSRWRCRTRAPASCSARSTPERRMASWHLVGADGSVASAGAARRRRCCGCCPAARRSPWLVRARCPAAVERAYARVAGAPRHARPPARRYGRSPAPTG